MSERRENKDHIFGTLGANHVGSDMRCKARTFGRGRKACTFGEGVQAPMFFRVRKAGSNRRGTQHVRRDIKYVREGTKNKCMWEEGAQSTYVWEGRKALMSRKRGAKHICYGGSGGGSAKQVCLERESEKHVCQEGSTQSMEFRSRGRTARMSRKKGSQSTHAW